jgi:hypothetical protein
MLLTLEWSEDTKSKMQTEALDEKEKWKARGSLCTLTGNKGSFMASPKKKKARQVKVLTEAVATMVIDVDFEKDIDATLQPVSMSAVEVPGIIVINEDKEDKDEEVGEEEVTNSIKAVAKGSPEAKSNEQRGRDHSSVARSPLNFEGWQKEVNARSGNWWHHIRN